MAARRIELGMEGAVLRLTVDEAAIGALTGALADGKWHEVAAEEGNHWVNLDEVKYVRVVPGEVGNRVGFGGS